jgi:predicted RNA binding protein YcfA (HicA-like mRNA interferase family)
MIQRRAFWKAAGRVHQTATLAQARTCGVQPLQAYDLTHMPVKVQELLARLEADGWFQVRQKGSHRQFRHPSKVGTVTVAGKPSVEVLKQAGLRK